MQDTSNQSGHATDACLVETAQSEGHNHDDTSPKPETEESRNATGAELVAAEKAAVLAMRQQAMLAPLAPGDAPAANDTCNNTDGGSGTTNVRTYTEKERAKLVWDLTAAPDEGSRNSTEELDGEVVEEVEEALAAKVTGTASSKSAIIAARSDITSLKAKASIVAAALLPNKQASPNTTSSLTSPQAAATAMDADDALPTPALHVSPLLEPLSRPGAMAVRPSGTVTMRPSLNLPPSQDRSELLEEGASAELDEENPPREEALTTGAPDGGATSQELLLNATLVEEDDPSRPKEGDVVFEAKPALEGVRAIVANPYFKYVALAFCLVLSTLIPLVAVLAPAAAAGGNTTTVEVARECGTRETKQADYRGTIHVTEGGVTCQRWDSQTPHSHAYERKDLPSLGMDENYCRNPEGDAKPWCYTIDPEIRWGWCDVPYCYGEEKSTNTKCGSIELGGADYRGTISITATGKTCQRWDSQYPQAHERRPEEFPNAGLDGNNYCRNPDYDTANYCYTTDNSTRVEYCDIPICEQVLPSHHNKTCEENCTIYDCGTPLLNQADYRGTLNVTISGRDCQRWDSQVPHRHSFDPALIMDSNIQNAGLIENYCRNPDGSSTAWCYTMDPNMKTDVCAVPYCLVENFAPRRKCGTKTQYQMDYRGDIAVTESGADCLSWMESVEANSVGFTPLKMPGAGLIGNWCRNPAAKDRRRAWCFIESDNSTWEYCDVPDCQECGTPSLKMEDYLGTDSVIESGRSCMYWKDKEAELVESNFTLDFFHLEENYCRNPDRARDDVWCYVDTNSSAWEYCSVPVCGTDSGEIVPTNDTCGSLAHQQTDYRGTINVTESGRTCQQWSSQVPHAQKFTSEDRPGSGLDGNYCRNPDGPNSPKAWCYTIDPDIQWEFCDVPYCESNSGCGTKAVQQRDYRGTMNATAEGIACQRWDSQEVHEHKFTPENYETAGLDENYCRNPDGSNRAWCITTNSSVLWAYCDVPMCAEDVVV